MPACFADHLLFLAYSGSVLPFGILFSGHIAELWNVAQLNHSLLHCHPADQNTRFALSWLPVSYQFLPTRRLHNTLHSRTCCSRHHLWPCLLCSISILSARATPCCISSVAKGKAFPPCQVSCCDYTGADQGVIRAHLGPCCTAGNESEKEMDEMSTLRKFRMPSRSCYMGHIWLFYKGN